jgi:hypothetical protein
MSPAAAAWAVPSARSLRELAFRRVDQVILGEIERARPRIRTLREAQPGAPHRDLVDVLVEKKKSFAGTGGLVSGAFGLAGVPLDLVMVTYLQISLAVEVALVYGANVKSRAGQREVLEIVARGNGIGPLYRGSTPVLARVAFAILRRRGWPALGRAVPVVAMPLSAWLNNRDIARVGEAAVRYYDGMARLAEKRRMKA